MGEQSARRGAQPRRVAGRKGRDRPHELSTPAGERSLTREPVGDRLYREISRLIVSGELADGAKLPSEAELCIRFGASRPVVREALARLRANGVIDSRRGSGSYVRRPKAPFEADFAPLGSINDLERWYEFRAVIESEAAYLAAKCRDAASLAKIRSALRQLESEIAAGRTGDDADFAFHMAIAEASKNPFFVDTMASVRNQVLFGISLARSLALRRPAHRNELVRAEHQAVYEAIRDGKPERARLAMHKHIAGVRNRVFDGKRA